MSLVFEFISKHVFSGDLSQGFLVFCYGTQKPPPLFFGYISKGEHKKFDFVYQLYKNWENSSSIL
jgi:hypothetical protein